MGTILASAIIADIRSATLDNSSTPRRSNDDLLSILNDAQAGLAIIKPDVCVGNEAVQMVAGTKQQIPSGYTSIVKLVRNLGTDGLTPGRVIVYQDFDKFQEKNPYWHQSDTNAEIKFWLWDKRDPEHYYIFPPHPTSGRGYAEGIFPKPPTAVAAIGDPITVSDIYRAPLFHYMLYVLNTNDSGINPYAAANAEKHWNMCVTSLGRMDLVKEKQAPKEDKRAD